MDLLPEPPEGLELDGTMNDERKVPPAEEFVWGFYEDPSDGGYNVLVSRWSGDDVEAAWMDLREELAAEIDLWLVVGQFVFAAYTPDDENRLATILAASPALTAECIDERGKHP